MFLILFLSLLLLCVLLDMSPVHRLTNDAGVAAGVHKSKSWIESSREYCRSRKETHSNEVIDSFS